jgi:hypothetical protein
LLAPPSELADQSVIDAPIAARGVRYRRGSPRPGSPARRGHHRRRWWSVSSGWGARAEIVTV